MYSHVINPILLVEMESSNAWFTNLMNFSKRAHSNVYIWLIRGPKENILVDCGGSAETLDRLGSEFSSKDVASPEEGLSKFGLNCTDIDMVIITQLHPDHIEFSNKYSNAKFIIQKDELEFGLNPHKTFEFAYVKEWYKDLNFEVIEGDTDIVPGVKTLFTPGHSPGGQSVVVNTNKGRYIIAGFCSVHHNFYPPKETQEAIGYSVIPPAVHLSSIEVYKNTLKLVQMFGTHVLLLHEQSLMKIQKIP